MISADTPSETRTEAAALRRLQLQILAAALLLLDLLHLVANLVHLATNSPGEPRSLVSGDLWNGDLDGSFIEVFGHAQLLAAAVALVFVASRRRSLVHGVWALVLVALVSDDFLQLHETFGATLVDVVGVPDLGFLSAQDIGELLVWTIASTALGALLLVGYARADREGQTDSRRLLALVALLAVFAVGLDQVQGLVAERLPFVLQVASTFAETAGELVAMTLIVLFVQAISLRPLTVPGRQSVPDPEDDLLLMR